MNIYNLRYFVTLARIRQYTKAAEELCITQPSLSHAISQMEKELGVKLFEKNGHKITLTQFGEEFFSYAEKTLDVLDDGIASIKRSAMGNGTIRLGLVRPLGISYVPRMAAAFIKKNPKLDIDFTFHTDVTGRLLDDMQLGKYDLLFCSKPSEEYHFTAEPVMKQRLVLITPKGHPLAKKRKRSINLAETAGYSYVCFDKNSGIRSIFDEMLKRSDITVKIAYETEEDNTLKTELQKIKRTDNLKIAIIIGPEGGIDKKEILQLKEVGAKTITLGQRILRTETASIVVISNIIYELEM